MTRFDFDTAYRAMWAEIIAEQAEILKPFGGSREDYFRSKGIEVPDDSDQLFDLWLKLTKQNNPDWTSVYLLSDARKVSEDPFPSSYIDSVFHDKGSPWCNKYRELLIKMRHEYMGLPFHAFEIAEAFRTGDQGLPQSIHNALYWYNECLLTSLETPTNRLKSAKKIYALSDVRREVSSNPVVGRAARYLLDYLPTNALPAEKFSDIKHSAAVSLIGSTRNNQDEERALKYYEDILESPSSQFINLLSIQNAIIRHALGWGTTQNLQKANSIFEANRQKLDIFKGLNHYTIEDTLKLAKNREFCALVKILRKHYEQGGALEGVIKDVKNGNFTANRTAILIAYAINILAKGENWETRDDWLNIYHHIRLTHYGFDPEKIMMDTFRLGPFYNEIAENGMPVLGAIHPVHYATPGFKIGESVEPGVTAFTGLVANSKGELSLEFDAHADQAALLFQEDVDTALALAFGKAKFQWPSIDMPYYDAGEVQLREAQEKIIEPPWLIKTAMGATFYITDFLGGRLATTHEAYPIVTNGVESLKALSNELMDAITAITKEAPNPKGNLGKATNVNAKSVPIQINENQTTDQTTVWQLDVGHIEMRWSGGYAIQSKKGHWHHKNDTAFQHGQICAKLTEEFDIVAKILPVFERLRQFTGLVYALNKLKEKTNFKPNAELQSHINQKQAEYEKRVRGQPPEYARSLPITDDPKIGF